MSQGQFKTTVRRSDHGGAGGAGRQARGALDAPAGITQTTRARAALEIEEVTISRAEYYDMQQEIDDLKAENARLREALRECHGWVPGDDEATAASILFKKALPNG